MQYLLILATLISFADAQEMTITEHQTLHRYNNRPSLKNSAEENAHKLHKVDEKRAKKMAQKLCKEQDIQLKLTHKNNLLYYQAKAKNCKIYINAMTGEVISTQVLGGTYE